MQATHIPEAGLGDLDSALSPLCLLGEVPSPFSASVSFSVSIDNMTPGKENI